jgi:alkylhydroperoxidase/carboxymuconolactone decarboxylase family protein YurZ
MCVMNQHESLSERLTRLRNICSSMEEALDHARGIEDDYRRGSLEAHIRGALREINAQRAEIVSALSTMHRTGHMARTRSNPHLATRVQETDLGTSPPRHN